MVGLVTCTRSISECVRALRRSCMLRECLVRLATIFSSSLQPYLVEKAFALMCPLSSGLLWTSVSVCLRPVVLARRLAVRRPSASDVDQISALSHFSESSRVAVIRIVRSQSEIRR